jgi:hypothetical protein
MNRTLQQLKESVDSLIKQQGADASCAALIFTKKDVFTINDEGEEVYFSEEVTNTVLNDLDESDYMLEQAYDCIADFLKYIQENSK